MAYLPYKKAIAASAIALSASIGILTNVEAATFVQQTIADNPLAYFQLNTTDQPSAVNGFTTTYQNGVGTGAGAPIANYPGNMAATFNGVNNGTPQEITTSLNGGINGAGSIAAFIRINTLPSTTGAIQYIAGESQFGNDFDLQVQQDNLVHFYTGAGENTASSTALMANQYYFVVATYDATAGFRDVYINGALDGSVNGAINPAPKTSDFTIGYSSVFGGRDFNGSIDEVSVFDYALSASQVSTLYQDAMSGTPTPVGAPAPLAGAGLLSFFGAGGVAMRKRAKRAIGSLLSRRVATA